MGLRVVKVLCIMNEQERKHSARKRDSWRASSLEAECGSLAFVVCMNILHERL